MPRLDPDAAIQALVEFSGNRLAAAEKLTRVMGLAPDDKITPQQITSACAENMPALKRAISADLTVSIYSMVDVALASASAALPGLKPEAAVHAVTQIMNLLHSLTDDKTAHLNVNVNEFAYTRIQQTDPELAELMAALAIAERNVSPVTILDGDAEGHNRWPLLNKADNDD